MPLPAYWCASIGDDNVDHTSYMRCEAGEGACWEGEEDDDDGGGGGKGCDLLCAGASCSDEDE